MNEPRRLTDPQVLKGLAHPLRQLLYRLLVQLGPSTVTALADHVEADPGQVSYHLRELGRRGFIEEAPELARDRRERWWRAVPGSIAWSTTQFDDPAARAAAEAAQRQLVVDEFERLQHYEATKDGWGPEWTSAVSTSNSYLRLTAEEMRGLADELNEVIARWSRAGRPDPEAHPADRDDDGRANVFLFFHAFPERP